MGEPVFITMGLTNQIKTIVTHTLPTQRLERLYAWAQLPQIMSARHCMAFLAC
ncbi:hypothetical protein HK100_000149, partial [Physocladia obscura]